MPRLGERLTKDGITGEWDGTTWRVVAAAPAHRVGDRMTKDGVTGEWDGSDWKAVADAPSSRLSAEHYASAKPTSVQDELLTNLPDFGVGIAKRAGKTVKDLADLGREYLPGFADLDKLGHVQVGTTVEPTNTAQKLGGYAEQMAEWYQPGKLASGFATELAPKLAPKLALLLGTARAGKVAAPIVAESLAQGAASVPMAIAHREDPKTAALMGAAVPAALSGLGGATKWAADTVAPAALDRVVPWLRKQAQDIPDLTPFARKQQIPVAQGDRANAASEGKFNIVNFLLGLRDESRPAVVSPAAREAAEAELARTATPGATTPIGPGSTRASIAGYLPLGREPIPLGPTPTPRGGTISVQRPDVVMRAVDRPAVPGPDRSGVDALVQTQTHLGGAAPALPKQRLGFSDNDIRLAESLGGQAHPAPTSALLGRGREAGTEFQPQYLGETHDVARPDVAAGPGVVWLPITAKPRGRIRGAPAQMVDPEQLAAGLGGVRAKLGQRGLKSEAVAELNSLQDRFLADHPVPMTLLETKQLARAENNLAHAAHKATRQGNLVQDIPSQFHRGLGNTANAIVREKAPEIIPHDLEAQQFLGLARALKQAQKDTKPLSTNPATWITPDMMSKGIYKADNLATWLSQALSSQRGGRNGLLLARLAAILGQSGAGDRAGGGQ